MTSLKILQVGRLYPIRCHPFFLVVIFCSPRTINLCWNKSSFTFWKKNFNKVSDKLLGQLLVLPVAKLKTACTKLVFVPRSLWSNLEQNQNIFWRGYHKASFVGTAWNKYWVLEPWTTSSVRMLGWIWSIILIVTKY